MDSYGWDLSGYICFIVLPTLLILTFLATKVTGIYNRLVEAAEGVRNAWAKTEIQLHRRHQLVDNLVHVVRGYTGYEVTAFQNVLRARDAASDMHDMADRADAECQLSAAMRSLLHVVVEQYPDLKGNALFGNLMTELVATENKISDARVAFCDMVAMYNTQLSQFPGKVVAAMFLFAKEAYFSFDPAIQADLFDEPKVSL